MEGEEYREGRGSDTGGGEHWEERRASSDIGREDYREERGGSSDVGGEEKREGRRGREESGGPTITLAEGEAVTLICRSGGHTQVRTHPGLFVLQAFVTSLEI